MATYKLIQDVEAEDHILGPLTLRQFIFGLVGVFCWYLSFIMFVRHFYFLLPVTVSPALFCTFFAIPFGRDQPTEVWALAKLRFWFKPRQRIWNQSGIKELVTITVPKKVERVLTKGYSQTEVESRLKALANTLDTRGWAVKNINASSYTPANYGQNGSSDRLIDIGTAPEEVPNYDIRAADDILDERSNPVAQQFQTMINQSAQEHRQHLLDEMNRVAPATAGAGGGSAGGWFMKPSAAPPAVMAAASPAPSVATAPAIPATPPPPIAQLPLTRSQTPSSYTHMRTLTPTDRQASPPGQNAPSDNSQPINNGASSGVNTPDPAILSLANNNDLNVSTLARQAYKATHGDEPPEDEVVVSLH